MRSPFPGMDPYLEHPALWPDVHNRLIAALSDAISPLVAPRYPYVALERRTYALSGDELVLIGRPDVAVVGRESVREPRAHQYGTTVLDVSMPSADEVSDSYLEVRDVEQGTLVTVVELLSPGNKLHASGRADYLAKRAQITRTRTNLLEIDLLRSGTPMPIVGSQPKSAYRVLVARGSRRPRAELTVFGIRDVIPKLSIPLAPGETEPVVDLCQVWHSLYERAPFDLRIDYHKDPVPPLDEADRDWARARIAPA